MDPNPTAQRAIWLRSRIQALKESTEASFREMKSLAEAYGRYRNASYHYYQEREELERKQVELLDLFSTRS